MCFFHDSPNLLIPAGVILTGGLCRRKRTPGQYRRLAPNGLVGMIIAGRLGVGGWRWKLGVD